MMKAKTPQNKFMKIITMPIRALAKARDFYVRSMNNYADKVCYGGGASYADPLPRSFSTNSIRSNSSNDDYRDLVRAASTSTLASRINLNSVVANEQNAKPSRDKPNVIVHNNSSNTHHNFGGVAKGVPRSASVGMAKIEEDKPIEFDDNFEDVNKNENGKNVKRNAFGFFPRSKSYAVGATKRTSSVF